MNNMKKTITLLLSCAAAFSFGFAQLTPEVTSWIINVNGDTGYGNILSNVQQVQYSTANVYVSCTCIPGYDIGPWQSNPNIPANQNFVYKITRTPIQNTGTPVATPMGHTGVWTNGVSIFNAKDGFSYNNMGIWNRNAIVAEDISFDDCLGHPAPNGEYHHHLNPTCLYADSNATVHAPIIGYAFDGFPIYGGYGYANPNGTGGIVRINSSYRMRNITQRTTLPDGTPLAPNQYGPAVNSTYPLGLYLEDFEYVANLGHLDEHNGRFCVTPEYPLGTYAYFATLDTNIISSYPYTMGPTYYGTVPPGNTGPGSGHNTISEPVTIYLPTGISEEEGKPDFILYPNPAAGYVTFFADPNSGSNMKVTLVDALGRVIITEENIQPAVPYLFDLSTLPAGIYYFRLENNGEVSVKRFSVVK
jgi:hypothetical protein